MRPNHSKQQSKKMCQSSARRLAFRVGLKGAERRHLAFDLSFAEVEELNKFPCFYCGTTELSRYGINLDRVDNVVGYTKDNVVTCCTACNQIKGCNLSAYEMVEVASLLNSMRSHHHYL